MVKHLILAVFILLSLSCSKNDKHFIENILGVYILDSDNTAKVFINRNGDIFVNNLKVYKFEETRSDTMAIYKNEVSKTFYGFVISGIELSITTQSFINTGFVTFNNLELYATKRTN